MASVGVSLECPAQDCSEGLATVRQIDSLSDRKFRGPWNPFLLRAQHPGGPLPRPTPQLRGSPATHIQAIQLLLHLALEHSHHPEEGWAHQALCLLLGEGFPVQQLCLVGDKAEPGLGLVGTSPYGLGLSPETCLPLIPQNLREKPPSSGDSPSLWSVQYVQVLCAVPTPCLTEPP